MKERPAIFIGEMVFAILGNLKTNTRRVIILPGDAKYVKYWDTPTHRPQEGFADPGVNYWTESGNHIDKCPYGFPGDHLWVRETWATIKSLDKFNCKQIAAQCADAGYAKTWAPIEYAIDKHRVMWGDYDGTDHTTRGRTRSARFMPRWASRITLEIVSVRVERIQDITEDDAIAEGAQCPGFPASLSNRDAFAKLWERINSKRGYGWEMNPWVWVVEFKRI